MVTPEELEDLLHTVFTETEEMSIDGVSNLSETERKKFGVVLTLDDGTLIKLGILSITKESDEDEDLEEDED